MRAVAIIAVAMAITMAIASTPVYAAGEPGAPTNLSITELGTGNLSFKWDKGDKAENTSVIGKLGSWPEDRDDGTELYSGNSTSFEDGPYSITFDTYYIRAWGENASVYSLDYAEASVGGDFMEAVSLIIFVALAAGLLLVGVIKKFRWVSAASAIPWALTAYFAYLQYDADGSLIWEMFALFGLVMFVVAGAVSIGAGEGGGEDSTGQELPRYIQTRNRLRDRLGDD